MTTQTSTQTSISSAAKFKVTRMFIGGLLNGLTHTEITSVERKVGFECLKPVGGSAYKIIAVEQVFA